MVAFTANIERFAEQGEKTGWTYIVVPEEIALQLKPGNKRSFKVKGTLDTTTIGGISLLPMGGGDFILPLKGELRKKLGKTKGMSLQVKIEVDQTPRIIPDWLIECLEDEPKAAEYFYKLAPSHQDYYIKWIDGAKTEATKTKRLAQAVSGFVMGMSYGEMIRYNRGK